MEKERTGIDMKKFGNIAGKVCAFVGFLLLSALAIATAFFIACMFQEGTYFKSEADMRKEVMGNGVRNRIGLPLLQHLERGEKEVADLWCADQGVFYATVISEDEGVLYVFGEQDGRNRAQYESEWEWYNGAYSYPESYDESVDYDTVKMIIVMQDELARGSVLYWENQAITLMYDWQYRIWAVLALELMFLIASFCYLMWASGRRADGSVTPGWGTFVPIEILTGATLVAGYFGCLIFANTVGSDDPFEMLVTAVSYFFCVAISIGWCMSVAVRLKLGILIKKSLLAYCWFLGKKFVSVLWPLVMQIPLVWRTVLLLAGISVAEIIALMCILYDTDMLLFFWLLEKIIIVPVVLYFAIGCYKLRKGARALADGDLSQQIDTHLLLADLKAHGKDLNNIGCGVAKAVEERLKSERMKTELITNVSHDIKTPVTSMINYSDLIQKEESTEKIKEYAEVLQRQSAKLKNLVDDLVEASKASSGNLEVNLEPFEIGVLVTQAAGEYENRLKDAGLELIVNRPDAELMIMADGRRMWRVFDNLLNNICKYALSGTRVYLTLEQKGQEVIVTFKNTSREALNIAPEELFERFTRADASRHTEGNGLGLSIAKSLVQLQNGTLDLAIDADLFKAVLCFPKVG